MTKKDEQIIKESKENGTPIFVLTAKDRISTLAMMSYQVFCSKQNCDKEFINEIELRINEFEKWQEENQGKVKKPN